MIDTQVWVCAKCDIEIPVDSGDPFYPDTVYCPKCQGECERQER